MTGKHRALEDNENKMGEMPVTAAPPGNQADRPAANSSEDDGGNERPGVSDPSTTAEDEALQMDSRGRRQNQDRFARS